MDRPKIVSRREFPIGMATNGRTLQMGHGITLSEGFTYRCSLEDFMRMADGPAARIARLREILESHEQPTTAEFPPLPRHIRDRSMAGERARNAKGRGWRVVK